MSNISNLQLKAGSFLKNLALHPTSILVVIVNLYPIYGIFYANWNVGNFIFYFWFESLVIGFFNIFKIILSQGDGANANFGHNFFNSKYSNAFFFILHYGFTHFLYGAFLYALFQSVIDFNTLYAGWITIFVIHLISFIFNYIGKGEYKTAKVNELFYSPYLRAFAMHLSIIFGTLLAGLGFSNGFFVLLIGITMIIDLKAHFTERGLYHS